MSGRMGRAKITNIKVPQNEDDMARRERLMNSKRHTRQSGTAAPSNAPSNLNLVLIFLRVI